MEEYTRQQLYDLVWSAPMRDAAKKLGLSDNGLRKHCVKSFVPLPPQGHWNKVHAGQKVKITPLPPRPPGVSGIVTIGGWDYQEHHRRLMETEPVEPIFEEVIEEVRARVSRNLGVVVASKNLSPPHAAFRRQVEDDARRAAQSSWHTPIFNPPLEKRRLRILQGLFYGLSRLGCHATVQGGDVRTIYISVGHQTVQITLDRVTTRRGRSIDDEKTGRLKLAIVGGGYSGAERISWEDANDKQLESQLSSIAAEIIVAGELQYREHLIWQHNESLRQRAQVKEEAEKRRIEQERAELQKIRDREAARLKRLTESVANFHQAQAIRTFVSSVAAVAGDSAPPERLAQWKAWAMEQADRIDPIVTGSIWGDVDDVG